MRKTTEIAAIHEDDSLAFLERLGLRDGYEKGDLVCSVCGEPLKAKGIGAARASGDLILFACAKIECLQVFSDDGNS